MVKSVSSKPASKLATLSPGHVSQIKKLHLIISNSNGKGGVGKTTYSAHQAWYASELLGMKVLVIDLDPDMHITKVFFGENIDLSVYASSTELFSDNEITKPVIKHPENDNLYFLPADYDLEHIGRGADADNGVALYPYFHLQAIRQDYDLIIIDCPPGKGDYRNAGMLASDLTVLITEMSGVSFSAVNSAIMTTDQLVRELNDANPEFQFKYPGYLIIPNKFKAARKKHRTALAELKESPLNVGIELRDFEPIEDTLNNRRPVWDVKTGNGRAAAKNFIEVINTILKAAIEGAKNV